MPIVSDGNPVQVQPNKETDLDAKILGDLALAKIDLFTNNITPTALSEFADFNLPTWTGYSQKAVAGWTAVSYTVLGGVRVEATNVVSWAGPGDGTGQTVYGYILRSAGAGNPMITAYKFPEPIGVEEVTDILSLVASYQIP